MNQELSTEWDCIVIGAGPAGLSASLLLARYRRKVLTVHHNSPRNIYSHGVNGFLGHQGIHPKEFLERGRKEVEVHGGKFLELCMTKAEKRSEEQFVISGQTGETLSAKRLILATGLHDETPDCPGFRDFYGSSVHHCPDCDGFEQIGKRIVVYGRGKSAVGTALSLLTWTDQLTLVLTRDSGPLDSEQGAKLASHKIPVVERELVRLEGDLTSKQIKSVRFSDESSIECDALFFCLGARPSCDLHIQLGCALKEDTELVRVSRDQETSVAGVYAAGDLTPNSQMAIVAAAEGAVAAIHLHKSLRSFRGGS